MGIRLGDVMVTGGGGSTPAATTSSSAGFNWGRAARYASSFMRNVKFKNRKKKRSKKRKSKSIWDM